MAEACYTVRATMKQQVIKEIGKLALQTNKHVQYMHELFYFCKKASVACL